MQDVEDHVHDYKKMKSYQIKVKKNIEECQEELYHNDHHKVTREILLHEMRIQEDQNKQLKDRLKELKNEEEEKLYLNEEKDCQMKQLLYQNDLLLYRLE